MAKSYDLSELTFLVVDDNNHMLSIIKTLLKGLGVQNILEASNIASGFEKFRTSHVDIIILDYVLETLDGIGFCQLVRLDEGSPNVYVPIIMLTAHAERGCVLEARDAGVTEFLRKPFCAKDLYDRILETIEHPRPFIRTETFFGPDRRRHNPDNYRGEERRKDRINATLIKEQAQRY